MKKQQKTKQQNNPKKKQPVTFQQRFKDKKSVVSKFGVLDLLGLHQPFDLNREITPLDHSPIVENNQPVKNPQKQPKHHRIMSESEIIKRKVSNSNPKANKTQKLGKAAKNNEKRQKFGLPRISKSSAHISIQMNPRQKISTKQYWKGQQQQNKSQRRRSNSQLSCFNMIKLDLQANHHWQNLAKFQKFNKNYRNSELKIQRG